MYWDQAKFHKLIPYGLLTNVPILYTTALSHACCAFATTFKAMEAPFF